MAICPCAPWVLTHWGSRRAACPPQAAAHAAWTRWLGTLSASVALTLKVCGGPGGRGLDPAQPQRLLQAAQRACPDLSPTWNHQPSPTGLSPVGGERAQWLIRQEARRLFDKQTQSEPQAPGFREEGDLSRTSVSLWAHGPGLGLTRGSSYTTGRGGSPQPGKTGVSCSHASSLLVQEGAEHLLGILLCHPCWAVQHSHTQNADQGGQPALPQRLLAQRSNYQTHIVLRSDP